MLCEVAFNSEGGDSQKGHLLRRITTRPGARIYAASSLYSDGLFVPDHSDFTIKLYA